MDVLFVTGNRNKFEEVKLMAEKHGINLLWSDLDVVEHKYDSVKEVSIAKALSAVKILDKPLIVEDTGIFFKDFKNFPGANAKVVINGIGIDGILKVLEGKNREATFVTSFAFAKPGIHPITFVGECDGKISEKPSDIIAFAYDTIFIPDGDSRTFSEMTKEEKEKYSHRRKALDKFFTWLSETRNI